MMIICEMQVMVPDWSNLNFGLDQPLVLNSIGLTGLVLNSIFSLSKKGFEVILLGSIIEEIKQLWLRLFG